MHVGGYFPRKVNLVFWRLENIRSSKFDGLEMNEEEEEEESVFSTGTCFFVLCIFLKDVSVFVSLKTSVKRADY